MGKMCEVCRAPLQENSSGARTCSVTCRNRLIASERSASKIRHKQCQVCGAGFSVGASEWNRETCSRECAYVLRGQKTSKRELRNCKTCGKEFHAPIRTSGSGEGAYCSRSCMYARNNTSRSCLVCGKEFRTPPSQMHIKTCSKECGYALSGGANKPNYKGVTYLAVVDGKKVSRRYQWAANEHSTARTRAKGRATPAWADKDAMRSIYKEAARISAQTGEARHVDHIVPLKSDLVCGLHCEANLRVVTAADNLKKHNRSWPDMP